MQDKQIGRDYPGTHDGRCTIKARIALEILRGIPQGGVVDWRTAVTSKKLRLLSLSYKVAWQSAVWRWIQRKPKSSIAKMGSAKVRQGQPEELADCDGRRQPSMGGTSRMNREVQVRNL